LIDYAIILLLALEFQFDPLDYLGFAVYVLIGWLILSVKSGFYEVYRFTRVTRIISLTFLQAVLFTLLVFAFFGIFEMMNRAAEQVLYYLLQAFGLILILKLGVYYLLKSYRKDLGGNYRITVIVGDSHKARQLKDFFIKNEEYGYNCQRVFHPKSSTFRLTELFKYIKTENVDEIYCSVTQLKNKDLNEIIDFADNNLKVLKFIPDNKDIYSKKLSIDYYGFLPILALRNIPIEKPLNQFLKRSFDIIFSIMVIVCVLSWLTPILAILIKFESKGPVFFRQRRNGLDYKEFFCYKFRSMKINSYADIHQVKRNDKRVTWIGGLLRKTSMDELPQFINVLIGDMSIVGPRPHMVSHTEMYAESVNKFMVRHLVKPGITGLAQTSGFRGQVETEHDINGRIKYDIFYVENWSLLLDIKIIFQTVYNALEGEDKAY
jgi:putative colanic acid biosynthesis UDP-glucose lipid carrier transferase